MTARLHKLCESMAIYNVKELVFCRVFIYVRIASFAILTTFLVLCINVLYTECPVARGFSISCSFVSFVSGYKF